MSLLQVNGRGKSEDGADSISVSVGAYSPRPGGKPLEFSAIAAQIGFLQGKVLTVVDASYSDEKQNKAVKDLINAAFRSQLDWIEYCCYPDYIKPSTAQAKQPR